MGVTVSGRKTQHYANGTPAINAKFPDIGALVKYGHSKGLKMGWSAPPTPPVTYVLFWLPHWTVGCARRYQNGCACGEHVALDINYEGDIRSLHGYDFVSRPSQHPIPLPAWQRCLAHPCQILRDAGLTVGGLSVGRGQAGWLRCAEKYDGICRAHGRVSAAAAGELPPLAFVCQS